MLRRKLSDEAVEALKIAFKDRARRIEWIALDAFRVWYEKPYWDEDGSVGREIVCKEFEVKEVKNAKV